MNLQFGGAKILDPRLERGSKAERIWRKILADGVEYKQVYCEYCHSKLVLEKMHVEQISPAISTMNRLGIPPSLYLSSFETVVEFVCPSCAKECVCLAEGLRITYAPLTLFVEQLWMKKERYRLKGSLR